MFVCLSVPPANCDLESFLENELARAFHLKRQYDDQHTKPRSGKPEEPVYIVYSVPFPGDVGDRLSRLAETYSSYLTITTPPTSTSASTPSDSKPDTIYYLYASDFWQLYKCKVSSPALPLRYITTNNTRHPFRGPSASPGSTLYERFIPSLNTTFALRLVNLHTDLADFHEWHNSERVNAFWGERGSIEHHKAYLERQLNDAHVLPVIGSFGGTAFGYFEIYWAKEDSIGPHADAQDWDAGFHALVGNEAHRGPEKVRIWISSITHYLFLRDIRTMRVMLEPRVDNKKFINYLVNHGYMVAKEFNFPHKRAALVFISREKFFETQGVQT